MVQNIHLHNCLKHTHTTLRIVHIALWIIESASSKPHVKKTRIAQVLERRAGNPEVRGSNPGSGSNFSLEI